MPLFSQVTWQTNIFCLRNESAAYVRLFELSTRSRKSAGGCNTFTLTGPARTVHQRPASSSECLVHCNRERSVPVRRWMLPELRRRDRLTNAKAINQSRDGVVSDLRRHATGTTDRCGQSANSRARWQSLGDCARRHPKCPASYIHTSPPGKSISTLVPCPTSMNVNRNSSEGAGAIAPAINQRSMPCQLTDCVRGRAARRNQSGQ